VPAYGDADRRIRAITNQPFIPWPAAMSGSRSRCTFVAAASGKASCFVVRHYADVVFESLSWLSADYGQAIDVNSKPVVQVRSAGSSGTWSEFADRCNRGRSPGRMIHVGGHPGGLEREAHPIAVYFIL
jgi:hypothetical protein